MKAVAYIRVSTQEQSLHGVSLDAQEARLRAYCTLTGLDLVEVVREEGVSAGKPLADRPGGKVVLDLLASGEASHVVALKLDRLFRDAVDAMGVSKDWDAAGVALHLVDMGGQTINTATAMGRFFLTMMAGFAELERNLISERTSTALQYKMSQGEHVGAVPLGFDRVDGMLLENRAEMAAVKRMRELRAQGLTLRDVAATMTAEGFTTKRGGKWHPQTVSDSLKRMEANG
ncbi:MAG: recombinase family protein [Candidatus Eremiobacteraeota bacterium]|nr:recombinase family protein [Candidatus Eremiobacteraeota bacterium]